MFISKKDNLLSFAVKYFNSGDVPINNIKELINDSTSENLKPLFSFLLTWVVEHHSSSKDDLILEKINNALKFIDMIFLKVPPVALVTSYDELRVSIQKSNYLLNDFFHSFNYRITNISSLVNLTVMENLIKKNSFGGGRDYESDNEFILAYIFPSSNINDQLNYIIYFKRLIYDYSPIDSFKPLLEYRESIYILTISIIDILTELNSSREATHIQLLFSFSTLFSYVQTFSQTNDIDGQILCEYLQTCPYISPFCMLAIVNRIKPSSYLYNLLIPKEIASGRCTTQESSINAILSQYHLIDMTYDDTLSDLIKHIPTIMCKYFLHNIELKTPSEQGSSDADIITFITLTNTSGYENLKTILYYVKDRQIDHIHVAAMSQNLMYNILFAFQYTFYECCRKKMFTPTLVTMTASVLASTLPLNTEVLASKFLRNNILPLTTEFVIRAVYSDLIHIVAQLPIHRNMIPFLLNSVKDGEKDDTETQMTDLQFCARLLLMKCLRICSSKFTDSLVNLILSCRDVIVILEYIDYTDTCLELNSYVEQQYIANFREKLINVCPIMSSSVSPFICDFNAKDISKLYNSFDSISVQCYESILFIKNQGNIDYILSLSPILAISVIRLLLSSTFVMNHDFARNLCSIVVSKLKDNSDSCKNSLQFTITISHAYLVISQLLLSKLVQFNHIDIAISLVHEMQEPLKNDSMPLHWLLNFTRQNCNKFNKELKQTLFEALKSIPFFNKYDISTLPKILDHLYNIRKKKILDPDLLSREYTSDFQHMIVLATCFCLLSDLSDEEIVEELTRPITDISRPYLDRTTYCHCVTKLASMLSESIVYQFFNKVVCLPLCDLTTLVGRELISNITYNELRFIYRNSYSLIGGSETKLKSYITLTLFSYRRIKGDFETAVMMLKGILESVTAQSSVTLLEFVIDVLDFTYMALNLHKSRAELINSCSKFPANMKTIIASSLEISPSINNSSKEYFAAP